MYGVGSLVLYFILLIGGYLSVHGSRLILCLSVWQAHVSLLPIGPAAHNAFCHPMMFYAMLRDIYN